MRLKFVSLMKFDKALTLNRRLNFALHYMALVRYRSDEDTKAYVDRRRAEGKSFKEAMRCLKRHLCNVVYRRMVSDWRVVQAA
jgi:hypothetical protein